MRITYNFRVDTAYCKSVVDRYYRQRPLLFRLPVQFGILGLMAACWWALRTNASSRGEVVGPLFIGALVFVAGVLVTKLGILLRLKSKAEFGQEVGVVITDNGVEASGKHTNGTWQWAAYPRSVRFSDGILLMRTGTIRWLPDSAIQSGTAEDATALVASNTVLRHVA